MRKIGSFLTMLMLCSVLAFAQTRTVTGVVRDDKGEPVPFATVTEAGTRNAVQADANGNFSIRINENGRLAISATGFTAQTIPVSGNTATVSLVRGQEQLTEVVVTGAYGTKRTARSTSYNAQVVSAEQLNVVRAPNLNNAIAGKVAGVQVRSQSSAALGRSGQVRLRGTSGLSQGEDVLYVVDGTIVSDANDINMDDVENVTVLQGPAASALFGAQGANGAIVISLKKGRKNARGFGVEVNLGATFEKVNRLPNYQNSYAGGADANLRKYSWKAGDPDEWKALDGKYYHDYTDDASWGPRMVGQEYIPWYAWYGGHKYSYQTAQLLPQEDNAKEFFNTGVVLNNSVAFSKATDVTNLRFSYGNVDIKGLLPQSSLKKSTFNFSGGFDITPRVTIGANINYLTQKVQGEINDDYSNQSTGSFNQWFHRNLDMGIMRELKDLRTPNGVWASWNHANPNSYNPANPNNFYAGNYWYNFFKWYDLATSTTNRDRLFGDVSLTYKITNDLRVKGTYRRQQTNAWFEEMFSSDLRTSGLQTQGNEPRAWGYYATGQALAVRRNLEFLATYNKKIGDYSINANAGTDFFAHTYKSNYANTNQGLTVPNYFAISNSKDPATVGNTRYQEKYRAAFASADLGYNNLVFLNATIRNDWFSTLPSANNAILSKSFGASFVFSDLIKESAPWLSYGKLRASWGEIPKALPGYAASSYTGTPLSYFGAYRYPGFQYPVSQFQWNSNLLMFAPDQLVDENIRGAVSRQKEIGLELRFLKNRLGLSATYWDGTETDIPQSIAIAGTSGYSSKLINAGEISKKGIELQFTARPLVMRNFEWDLSATYGRLLENKVIKVAPGVDRITIVNAYGSNSPGLVHEVGKQWGQLFGGGIKRINGQPVLDASGHYVREANVYFGNVLPKYTGGVQNSFQVLKNFTLNVNIDYQVGGKFFSLSDMWGTYSGLTARTATVNDKGNPIRDAVADGGGVRVDGVDADGKPVTFYVEAQEYFHQGWDNKVFDEYIYDLTFVKLRELGIGYRIPVDKIGISKWAQNATFTLVARNPILIYAKTKDFDPAEVANVYGERGQLPGTRGYGFNLKIGF